MGKIQVDYTDCFRETMEAMRGQGLLLVTRGKDRKPNIMTIAWGTIGEIWGRPVFIVLVRPSRHTFKLLAEREEFTVNVPSANLAKAAEHCGSVSGREHDKFKEMKLTAMTVAEADTPIIKECRIHYVCRVLHQNDLLPETLNGAVKERFYPQGDFHRVYYGQILAAYAER
ncbi:MAG: flavin reductase family protein [Planctomycetaceae bacterium]|nr:flavin reductase family protein [Planctomycetaceae bacterium]